MSLETEGFFRAGYCQALDEARDLRDGAHDAVLRAQDRLRHRTGVAQLRIRRTADLGFVAEVPQRFSEAISANGGAGSSTDSGADLNLSWARTLKNSVRFKAPALQELDRRVADAAHRAATLEAALFDDLCDRVRMAAPAVMAMCRACAIVDVSAGLADAAARLGLERPVVLDRGEQWRAVELPAKEQESRREREAGESDESDESDDHTEGHAQAAGHARVFAYEDLGTSLYLRGLRHIVVESSLTMGWGANQS